MGITPNITPKIIGLCGYPLHGKTTAQRLLEQLGVESRDDADELRRRVCANYNLTWEQVTTQKGKLQIVPGIDGKMMTVRQLLGDYGQIHGETPHGPCYWIDVAIDQLRCDVMNGRDVNIPVSFGSLRRSQASAVKAAGGFVLAVQDPRKPMSSHYFDEYDYDYVDVMVFNDGDLQDLASRVLMAISEYYQPSMSVYASYVAKNFE